MWIGINNTDGLPIFAVDQLMMVPAIRECYKQFGIHGLYYAILFGWDGSPYRGKKDVHERNALAYIAIKDVEIYDPMKEKKMRSTPKIYPGTSVGGMYENKFIKDAIAALNSLARLPSLNMRNYYFSEIQDLEVHLGKMKLDSTNTTDFQRQIKTRNDITKQIRDMTDEIEKIDKALEERFKIDKFLSLNELIQSA